MRTLILLFSFFLLPVINAQETMIPDVPVTNKVLPGLKVSEIEHDLGDIYFGRQVEHEFVLTNVGNKPIKIVNMRVDCGCSASLSDEAPVQPGASCSINVIYKPEYKTGAANKRITVYTDVTSAKNPCEWFELTLKASIKSLLKLEPGNVYFKKVNSGSPATESVKISASDNSSVTITDVNCKSEYLETKLEKTENKPDEPASWILNLTLKETAPVGRFSDTVTIKTDSKLQSEINLDVMGFVRGTVTVRPTQCYLGTLSPGDSVDQTFTVSETGEETSLEEPSISDPPEWLKYTIETESEKKRYKVNVTFTVPNDQTGRFSKTFTINVGHKSLKEVEIPVFGYILSNDMLKKMTEKNPESDDSGLTE